jgi:hypothetical protein
VPALGVYFADVKLRDSVAKTPFFGSRRRRPRGLKPKPSCVPDAALKRRSSTSLHGASRCPLAFLHRKAFWFRALFSDLPPAVTWKSGPFRAALVVEIDAGFSPRGRPPLRPPDGARRRRGLGGRSIPILKPNSCGV